jgi:hypothetical protein
MRFGHCAAFIRRSLFDAMGIPTSSQFTYDEAVCCESERNGADSSSIAGTKRRAPQDKKSMYSPHVHSSQRLEFAGGRLIFGALQSWRSRGPRAAHLICIKAAGH